MERTTKPAIGAAVVTGGGKGIGKSIALALAALDYRVAVFDVLEQEGRNTAAEIRESGGEAIFRNVDVSDEAQVFAAAAGVQERLGPVAVLVNNAGIYPRGDALTIPVESWFKAIHVNLGGAFLCSRAFAPAMLENGQGSIVNIASGRGLQGTPKGSHYAASKAGIISLTKSLALEWAPHIRVNTVIPGVTDTDQPREGGKGDEELYARGRRIPLGRIGQPSDIAEAVCFLIGEHACYITGQSLCVNGGAIMQ